MSLEVLPSHDGRRWRWAFLALFVYWVALVVGTHLPATEVPGSPPVNDKLLHFTAYAILGALAYHCLQLRGVTSIGALVALWCALALHGVLDEVTQQLVPGRSADAWDALADLTGISVAIGLYRAGQWARVV